MFSNNTNRKGELLMKHISCDKDKLLVIFEEMFGSGGYAGKAVQNLDTLLKKKKFSLITEYDSRVSTAID